MWNIIQCAVKGRSHEKVNMPCQDKTYALFENDVQTIALADGAGSAKYLILELKLSLDVFVKKWYKSLMIILTMRMA